jgi:hypothetical protein
MYEIPPYKWKVPNAPIFDEEMSKKPTYFGELVALQ